MSQTVTVTTISMTGAMDVIDACIAEAESMDLRIVAWVVDPGGNDVAMVRMDGSPLLSRQVAADKAWTAVALGVSTQRWAGVVDADPGLLPLAHNNRMMAVPGGIPLMADGVLIGAVGVSGASAEQDHQIASAGVTALVVTETPTRP